MSKKKKLVITFQEKEWLEGEYQAMDAERSKQYAFESSRGCN